MVGSTIRPSPKNLHWVEIGVYCPDISGDSLWMVDTELHFVVLKESVGDLILNFLAEINFLSPTSYL